MNVGIDVIIVDGLVGDEIKQFLRRHGVLYAIPFKEFGDNFGIPPQERKCVFVVTFNSLRHIYEV